MAKTRSQRKPAAKYNNELTQLSTSTGLSMISAALLPWAVSFFTIVCYLRFVIRIYNVSPRIDSVKFKQAYLIWYCPFRLWQILCQLLLHLVIFRSWNGHLLVMWLNYWVWQWLVLPHNHIKSKVWLKLLTLRIYWLKCYNKPNLSRQNIIGAKGGLLLWTKRCSTFNPII